MINEAQNTIFDNMKKRLTNPFLFTYFWLFCTCNYKLFLFLGMEPLIMSAKLDYVNGKWNFLEPFVLSLLAVLFFSYMDVLVDYVKESAERSKRILFNKYSFKKYYTGNEFDEIQKRYRALRADYDYIESRYDTSKINSIEERSKDNGISKIKNDRVRLIKHPSSNKEKGELNDSLTLIRLAAESNEGKLVSTIKPIIHFIKNGENIEIDEQRIMDTKEKVLPFNRESKEVLDSLAQQGYFVVEDGTYALTTKGFDLYDQIKHVMA